jgi:glutamyl-tRNA synthetase
MTELIEAFSLDRVGKSGSKFDPEKAKWFNHQYLIQRSDKQLASEWKQWLKTEKNLEPESVKVVKIVSLIKERVNFVKELWDEASFFFEAPESYDEKVIKKRWKTDSPEQMENLATLLDTLEDFTAEKIDEKIKNWIADNELSMGGIMNALRLLLVGAAKGPHLGDIMEVLGKAESIKRIRSGIKTLLN